VIGYLLKSKSRYSDVLCVSNLEMSVLETSAAPKSAFAPITGIYSVARCLPQPTDPANCGKGCRVRKLRVCSVGIPPSPSLKVPRRNALGVKAQVIRNYLWGSLVVPKKDTRNYPQRSLPWEKMGGVPSMVPIGRSSGWKLRRNERNGAAVATGMAVFLQYRAPTHSQRGVVPLPPPHTLMVPRRNALGVNDGCPSHKHGWGFGVSVPAFFMRPPPPSVGPRTALIRGNQTLKVVVPAMLSAENPKGFSTPTTPDRGTYCGGTELRTKSTCSGSGRNPQVGSKGPDVFGLIPVRRCRYSPPEGTSIGSSPVPEARVGEGKPFKPIRDDKPLPTAFQQ